MFPDILPALSLPLSLSQYMVSQNNLLVAVSFGCMLTRILQEHERCGFHVDVLTQKAERPSLRKFDELSRVNLTLCGVIRKTLANIAGYHRHPRMGNSLETSSSTPRCSLRPATFGHPFIKAGDIWSSLSVVVLSRHDGWLVTRC